MLKPEKDDWAVISGGSEFPYALVCFIDSKTFYWGQSRSRCVLLNNHKIVEIIGKVNSKDWDRLEIDYIKKYYPLKDSPAIFSAGWISPDGKFFTCNYGGHRSLSKHLSAHYYDTIEDTEKILEDAGWLKIYKTGVLAWDYERELESVLTKKQKNILTDFIIIDGDEEWNDRIKMLSRYVE